MGRMPAVHTLPLVAALLVGLSASTAAQERGAIVGVLIDQVSQRPLAGGLVAVPEAGVEVTTGQDGSFEMLALPAGEVTIRVRATGYSGTTEPVEVTPGEISYLQFYLMPMSAMLDEVMVITGRRTRDATAGSPAVEVETAGFDGRAETATDLLIAQVPGLSVSRGSGSVGSGSSLRIRGINTITGSTQPAIYLDGIRLNTNASFGLDVRSTPTLQALDMIPASQVKRIRVLRGSSAGAMYGDSSNGVILIETHARTSQ